MKRRLLLVENEQGLVLTLTDRLRSEGFDVDVTGDGEEAEQLATEERFDLIVLDVMLPRKNGFDVCRDLRRQGIETPILMLTARKQLSDKVVGLKLGADDYLTKPFEMMELLARIEALLRRAPSPGDQSSSSVYQMDGLRVDVRTGEVHRGDREIDLSAREFQLLRYFVEHRGELLTRDELLNEVWGYDSLPTTRTVDVHVAWLRQKVEEDPRHPRRIITVHGRGYKFVG